MMPIDYRKYPKNWKTEIRPAILKRANNCCEFCGIQNGQLGYRNKLGAFIVCEGMAADAALLDGKRVFRVVLTVAHMNHEITDNQLENLRALCQKCHLEYDKERHAASRWKNKNNATPDLAGLE